MLKEIKNKIKNLPNNFVILTIVPYNKAEKINLGLLEYLINGRNNKGSYVTINKPYQSIN